MIQPSRAEHVRGSSANAMWQWHESSLLADSSSSDEISAALEATNKASGIATGLKAALL